MMWITKSHIMEINYTTKNIELYSLQNNVHWDGLSFIGTSPVYIINTPYIFQSLHLHWCETVPLKIQLTVSVKYHRKTLWGPTLSL